MDRKGLKICYFADGESIHIERWCKHFASRGDDVHLISYKDVKIEGVTTHFVDVGNIAVSGGNWKVVFKYQKVKKLLKKINPDILHAHYATSYGFTGALCNFHPYVITTLGTDVLISARQSKIYKAIVKYALSKADWINSLANHMTEAIAEIGVDMKKVGMIPFGIDDTVFNDTNRKPHPEKFVIVSTRNHEEVYNIAHLIKAVALVKNKIPNLDFRIAGGGSLRESLEQLSNSLEMSNCTTFLGKISQTEMVQLLNEANLYATVSLSDGNSLSLAEAMACGALCIGSDIPGNRQWLTDGYNGFLVKIDDVEGLADCILNAYMNYDELQKKTSAINKKLIVEKGVWRTNMDLIEKKYRELIAAK